MMNKTESKRARMIAGAVCAAVLLGTLAIAGCGGHKEGGKHGGPGKQGGPSGATSVSARPPTPVDTVSARVEQVTDYRDFTGRTAPAHAVEIRPRVGGYLNQTPNRLSSELRSSERPASARDSKEGSSLREVSYRQPFLVQAREGEKVTAGTPLFEIDPRPYEFALEQARGNRIALEAQLERFRSELNRLEKLKPSNAISDTDLELAKANLHESEGQYQTLLAAEKRAELDLEFTQIKAPISGILGRSLINPENVVTADTTLLTTIVAVDPIHVYFDIDEASFLQYRDLVRTGKLPAASEGSIPVALALSNDASFPYQGHIDFQNNTTDPGTGNTLIRAEFANEQGLLTPGLYCQVRVPFSAPYEAVLVPTKCLAMDQQGKYLMVVDSDNTVQRRTVDVGTTHGSYSVIREGLMGGEQVVYEGLQKIRPKDRVQPVLSTEVPPLKTEQVGP